MAKIYAGDDGTRVILNMGADMSLASAITIQVKNPLGVISSWPAVVGADKNTIEHITSSADIPLAGKYKLQAHLTLPGWTGMGDVTTLKVYAAWR